MKETPESILADIRQLLEKVVEIIGKQLHKEG